MTLGKKLKALRTDKGMTQETFAEKMNVSRSAVAKWEADNGIPDINNLIVISRLFDISLDDLLDQKRNTPSSPEKSEGASCEYTGYRCDIDLSGWNDGVYGVLVLGEDKDFLFYQKTGKEQSIFGMIGKKYITTIQKCDKDDLQEGKKIHRDDFCNKHVMLELAQKEGFFSGFFDFRNDDFLDVVPICFEGTKLHLQFGREMDISSITKMEILPD